jgi:SecD/SecF fusion protein
MTPSVKWRLIIIGIVIAFALFNLYPTLKWASLSPTRRAELTARWDKQADELREDVRWDRLSRKEKLAEVHAILSPLQEAYEDNGLDREFWKHVANPDLASLSDEEKEDFLSLCHKLTGKEIPTDPTADRLREFLAPLLAVRERLDKDFWDWVQRPQWDTLRKKERERYRQTVFQLTGKRIARSPSVFRNLRNWFGRWWHGDENQVVSLGLDLKGGSYFVVEVEKPAGVPLSDAAEGAIRVLEERVNRTGVREPIIQRQGLNKIIVQLPGMTDVNRARRHIEEPAFMRWLLVDETRLKLPQFSDERRLLDLYERAAKELDEEFSDRKDEEGNPLKWTMSDLDKKLADSLPPDTILRILEPEERRGGRTAKEAVPLLLQSSPEQPEVIKGSEVTRAQASPNPDDPGYWRVNFTLNREGARRFATVTREYSATSDNRIFVSGEGYRGWRLAILLDDKVVSAPNIETEILSGAGQITGRFADDEARDLAIDLQTGALPAKLNIVAQNTIGPTLGADSIRKGVLAAMLGLALVVFFMAVYYLLAGVIANFALSLNIVIILGVLASLRATLTLPGIAGIILTIGMAVDANVLIFERIREELAAAKKIAAAIDSGYQKAFRTILDANMTTFISAIVLYYIGSGPVRGFAVTLMIGLATSMFTAIVVTRVVFDLLLRSKRFNRLRMFALLRDPKVDFVRQMGKAVTVSAIVIAVGLISFGAKWSDNFGIDFSGGNSTTLVFEKEVTTQDLSKIRRVMRSSPDIEDFKLRRLRLQGQDFDSGVAFDAKLSGSQGSPSIADRLAAIFPDNPVVSRSEETIYPIVAHRLWRQAIIAVVVAMLGMIIYISWRFEFRFALGAILALFHDVFVTLAFLTGFFLLTRRQLNLPIVAAILTIIGYSVNDTIVVFDRIREDMKIMKGVDLRTIVNTSINQTLSRTILTSLTTLLVVICLFVLGGQAINDFSFAMFVGLIAGTYSTIYIASPIVLLLEKKR